MHSLTCRHRRGVYQWNRGSEKREREEGTSQVTWSSDQQPEARTEETKASIRWREREREGGKEGREQREQGEEERRSDLSGSRGVLGFTSIIHDV